LMRWKILFEFEFGPTEPRSISAHEQRAKRQR
jgi:hypothetical protein